MKKIIFIFAIIVIFLGCGKKVYVDTQLTPVSKKFYKSQEKVLILPFTNYSNLQNFDNWLKINLLLHNAISQFFLKNNIKSEPFTNTFNFLKEQGFFKKERVKNNISPSVMNELNNPNWSNEMRKEIIKVAFQNRKRPIHKNRLFFIFKKDFIEKINKNFHPKYIIWGEIYEFSIEKEDTYNPIKIGFINSPVKIISDTIFGPGESSGWSTAQHIFSGILLGGVIGSFSNDPFNHSSSTTESAHLFGLGVSKHHSGPTDYEWGNAAFWGAATGFASFIGEHGGNFQKITLGLKLYIFDSNLEQQIWTNKIKIHITPESMYSHITLKEMIEYAVNKSINELLNNFWSYWEKVSLNSVKN